MEFEIIARQMIRSATGGAANYRAACRAKSNRDFINKLKIVEEEIDESMFWIELVVKLGIELKEIGRPLYQEADELLAIKVSPIKTARKKEGNNSSLEEFRQSSF